MINRCNQLGLLGLVAITSLGFFAACGETEDNAGGAAGTGQAAGGNTAGGSAGQTGGGLAGAAGQAGATTKVEWQLGASLKTGRYLHTTTLLDDGRLMVIGGAHELDGSQLASVEMLDPAGTAWTEGPPLPEGRSAHAAVKLADGRVLIVGGGTEDEGGAPSGEGVVKTAFLFDPVAGTYAEIAPMAIPRSHVGAGLLKDGRVVVTGGTPEGGGVAKTTEIYDVASNTWTTIDGPKSPTSLPAFATLADGSLVVSGGDTEGDALSGATAVFDGNAWTSLPKTDSPRFRASMAVLPSGTLMVLAGLTGNAVFSDTVELLPPGASAWKDGARLKVPGGGLGKFGGPGTVATSLSSGRVLVTGTYGAKDFGYGATSFAAIYDEATDEWTRAGLPIEDRAVHTATLLPDGRVIVVGGLGGSNERLETTEISDVPIQ